MLFIASSYDPVGEGILYLCAPPSSVVLYDELLKSCEDQTSSGTVNDSSKLALPTAARGSLHVKLYAIFSLNEAFIACNDAIEAEKLITTTIVARGFQVMSSPALRARRTVFLKRRDMLITTQPIDELRTSIEDQNSWATVEHTKIPNASSMLKITFTDVNKAAQALVDGMAIFCYYINPSHIEAERYQHITQCWDCCSYLHSKDCIIIDKKFWSTFGCERHDFKASRHTSRRLNVNA